MKLNSTDIERIVASTFVNTKATLKMLLVFGNGCMLLSVNSLTICSV